MNRALAVVLVFALLSAAAYYTQPAQTQSDTEFDRNETERLIIEQLNERRTAKGLGELQPNKSIDAVAESHTRDMVQQNYTGHDAPNGSDVDDRYRRHGLSDDCEVPGLYENQRMNPEVVATLDPSSPVDGYPEQNASEKVVKGWHTSEGHHIVIYAEEFTQVGVSVGIRDGGLIVVTANFC